MSQFNYFEPHFKTSILINGTKQADQCRVVDVGSAVKLFSTAPEFVSSDLMDLLFSLNTFEKNNKHLTIPAAKPSQCVILISYARH